MTNPSESPSLAGVTVAVFEARMAGTVADMIARHGGIVLAAPALREIPLGEGPEAADFAQTLTAGGFDVVIFETGVGVRYLADAIETQLPRETWIGALEKTRVVARGPKPAAALRELGARVDFQVPSPNTWHETLGLLDEKLPVEGLRVAVQEYGAPNAELVQGLELRGATVTRVRVYRWALPEDLEPLRAAIAEIAMGRVGIALFTSSQQVEHLLSIAALEGREASLRAAMAKHTVVGSIGPTTSETLRNHGLPVDIEPVHPKLGHLIAAIAAGWRGAGKASID
jgi:uroporphyrinogen-III synthase